MSSLSQDQQQFVQSAKKIYEEKLKIQLERDHFGEVIAVEPESGEYILGKTYRDVDVARRERFGQKPVHIFRVGGGGAVKIGGGYLGRVSWTGILTDTIKRFLRSISAKERWIF